MSIVLPPLQNKFRGSLSIITRGFDFSTFGEVLAGGTLSSPTIDYLNQTSGIVNDGSLTIAGATVNTTVFFGSEGEGDIQIGQGVVAQFSRGTPGVTYTLYCRVNCTPVDSIGSGDTLEIQAQETIIQSN